MGYFVRLFLLKKWIEIKMQERGFNSKAQISPTVR